MLRNSVTIYYLYIFWILFSKILVLDPKSEFLGIQYFRNLYRILDIKRSRQESVNTRLSRDLQKPVSNLSPCFCPETYFDLQRPGLVSAYTYRWRVAQLLDNAIAQRSEQHGQHDNYDISMNAIRHFLPTHQQYCSKRKNYHCRQFKQNNY